MGVALNNIEVGMGEGVVTTAPNVIASLGLGSCVAVALYDRQRKIGGLAHIMLPDSNSANGCHSPYHCADTAITALIKGMRGKGVSLQNVRAKMVGGAQMFADYDVYQAGIGAQNIVSIKHLLARKRIPVTAEDTGGHYGRSIEFHLDSGKVLVRAIGKEAKEI